MKLRNVKTKRPSSQGDLANSEVGDVGNLEPKVEDVGSNTKAELASTAAKLMADEDRSEFDAAKVARMAQAIADGTYDVNAEAIADKMIEELQELLGKVVRPK